MTASDDRILELLADSGHAHNPRGITNNILNNGDSISYNTVKRRTKKLLDAGFIEDIGGQGTYYKITEDGRAYLRGDLEAPEP